MKNNMPFSARQWPLLTILCALAFLLSSSPARAGLSLELDVIRYGPNAYFFFPYLYTNSTPPNITYGDYALASPGSPDSGIHPFHYHFDTNGFYQTDGFSWGQSDFASMAYELTNNVWSLYATNSVTTNVYHFGVMLNISSNDMPIVNITFPSDGAINVTNLPTFAWQGPTNYDNLVVYYFNRNDTLPPTQTNLLAGRELYQGPNGVTVHYDKYSNTEVVATTPTNSAGQAISSWVSTNHLQDYISSQFTVGTADPSGTSHTLVAHYTWNATNNDGTPSGMDSSGNSFDLDFGSSYGSGAVGSTDSAAAGPRAIQFQGPDYDSGGYAGWNSTPPNLLTTLAGSFSISCWIKTTQNNYTWDQGPAYEGAGIVSADVGGVANDVIPIALTGNTIGFNTGGGSEDVTLNSYNYVTDGNYHHIVVTRNQATGQKIIYIDGVLDTFGSGSTNLLDAPQKITIGALSDAGNADPGDDSYYNGYDGSLDDLQIYSGVLSSNEVAQMYANPGLTADQIISVPLVGRYDFEITNDIFTAGTDSSGNGNDAGCSTGNGGPHEDAPSTDAAVGSFARQFNGDTAICFYSGSTTYNNISNAIYGDFSYTAWVKTTHSVNDDSANAYYGSPILFFYENSVDQISFSITGSKAAFTTGNPNGGSDTTLHSATSVNDGNYHHLAATRNATTGVMKLYVDGVLEDSGTSTNGPRVTMNGMDLAGNWITNFTGLLDDVRIYGGELSAANVAALAGVPYNPNSDFNTVLGTSNLTWITSGDTSWFAETTNTYNSSPAAAQSGSVTNDQSSTLSVTVIGPGTLYFYWSSIAEDPNGAWDYEFDIDGEWQDDIWGDTDWYREVDWRTGQPYVIPAGTHTLTWFVSAYGDTDPGQAGFLDEVVFVPNSSVPPPVITLQPVDQTNYPGYTVSLLADSTNSPTPSWQWYKVGIGLISGATNKYYAPTNSGTATVAGSYYAAASTVGGSTTSRTAVVSFANATLPPDWSAAFPAQLTSYDGQNPVNNYGIACLFDQGTPPVIYTANSFTGTNTFASDTLIAGPGRYASGLLKHFSTGGGFWGRAITNNGSGNSYPQCLAPGPHDYIYNYDNGFYMSGVFLGTNGIGTNVLQETAGASIYLVRFDLGGSVLWVRTFGGGSPEYQSYHQLVSDPAGNVTISALGNNSVSFGSTNISLTGQNGILVQYDVNGNIRWIQQPSGWVQYMTYDSGRMYVAFDGNSTNYIGGMTNTSDRKWALAALNATNGQALWLLGIGSEKNDYNSNGQSFDTPQIAVSGTNVFVTGTGWGSNAVFGAYSVSWPQPNGQYFARYDTNGNAQLAAPFGGTRVAPWVAKADPSGNVYVAGDFDGYATFGSKTIAGPHYDDIGGGQFFGQIFVAKFDRDGNNLWVRQAINHVSYVNVRDMALAADGIWVDGFLNQNASFGPYNVTGPITCVGTPFCSLDYYVGGFLAKITETTPATAVTILNPQRSNNTIQFSFVSQTGHTNAIEARTNLTLGVWTELTNFIGDGTLKQFNFTSTNPPIRFFRVRTQ